MCEIVAEHFLDRFVARGAVKDHRKESSYRGHIELSRKQSTLIEAGQDSKQSCRSRRSPLFPRLPALPCPFAGRRPLVQAVWFIDLEVFL